MHPHISSAPQLHLERAIYLLQYGETSNGGKTGNSHPAGPGESIAGTFEGAWRWSNNTSAVGRRDGETGRDSSWALDLAVSNLGNTGDSGGCVGLAVSLLGHTGNGSRCVGLAISLLGHTGNGGRCVGLAISLLGHAGDCGGCVRLAIGLLRDAGSRGGCVGLSVSLLRDDSGSTGRDLRLTVTSLRLGGNSGGESQEEEFVLHGES